MKRSRCQPASRRLPRLKVTTDGQGLVSHSGARLLADLAEGSGLAADLSAALAPIVKGPAVTPLGRCWWTWRSCWPTVTSSSRT